MRPQFKFIDPDLELPPLDELGGGEPSRTIYTGMKALMLAVLEDGIRSYLSPTLRVHREADLWLWDGRSRSPFSFVAICEAVGLDPIAAREAVKRLRHRSSADQKTLRRSRPNVRRPSRVRVAVRR